ncbi:respiratory nitrate reductase subunit gamma, partial [Enterobacter hormaechei]
MHFYFFYNKHIVTGYANFYRLNVVVVINIFIMAPYTRVVHVWSAGFDKYTRGYVVLISGVCFWGGRLAITRHGYTARWGGKGDPPTGLFPCLRMRIK